MGDGAHRYHHEAQAGRRPVWGGVRGSLEEVQPDCSCENTKGKRGPCCNFIISYNVLLIIYSFDGNESATFV